MKKYEKLDVMILEALDEQARGFNEIIMGAVGDECVRLSDERKAATSTYKQPFRFLDARLQALRKAGKIASTGKGWIRK
ncbi:hypothetical protein HDG34_005856 [Paraburkholderia sp. HC6.4b]|uniref:hypothetical protein n=1 Tax=unclassified Paraburkholderia TaxID=2615204 RepID=UPI00161F9EE0|nr:MULTISPECIES: hypothetical protein [unclassified Paraburkholderia]MBB5411890.1 hypothetical protein [Paraburkholderia sp. HC6.4b]MBB5450202.1 hypothetical protein [Paraburkholderia sp. Kb1A]